MSSPTITTTPQPTSARYSAATWSGSRSGSPAACVATSAVRTVTIATTGPATTPRHRGD